MSIITLERYKLLADITDSSCDMRIEAFIPLVESDYLTIRNRPFDNVINGETNEIELIYPVGSELTAYEMLRYKLNKEGKDGKTSESIGSYSYSLSGEFVNGYPSCVVTGIKRWARTNV